MLPLHFVIQRRRLARPPAIEPVLRREIERIDIARDISRIAVFGPPAATRGKHHGGGGGDKKGELERGTGQHDRRYSQHRDERQVKAPAPANGWRTNEKGPHTRPLP